MNKLLLGSLLLTASVVLLSACARSSGSSSAAQSSGALSSQLQSVIDKAEDHGMLPEQESDSEETKVLYNWIGVYADGKHTLTIEQTDQSSLEYTFGSGKEGSARISGNTAKDETYNFVISGDTITVAGEGDSGNYIRQ